MDITLTITQTDHDLVLSQLRKKDDGTDDLTVLEWAQQSLNGKILQCRKRSEPVAVLEAEKAALESEKTALQQRIAELEAEG